MGPEVSTTVTENPNQFARVGLPRLRTKNRKRAVRQMPARAKMRPSTRSDSRCCLANSRAANECLA